MNEDQVDIVRKELWAKVYIETNISNDEVMSKHAADRALKAYDEVFTPVHKPRSKLS